MTLETRVKLKKEHLLPFHHLEDIRCSEPKASPRELTETGYGQPRRHLPGSPCSAQAALECYCDLVIASVFLLSPSGALWDASACLKHVCRRLADATRLRCSPLGTT